MEDTQASLTFKSAAKRGARRSPCAWIGPKAAMLGMSVGSVATTIQTNVAGTTAAQFRERGNEYPVVVRLREADREEIATSATCC